MAIILPEPVRQRAIRAGAYAWVEGLADMVADFEREWGISTGAVLSGGSEALVLEATLADGTPSVLKLLLPHVAGKDGKEIAVLRLADGEGCARLYDADEARGAMLIERLGHQLAESGLSRREKAAILCDAARRLWRPVPGAGFMSGAEKARWLIDFIQSKWKEFGRPCSEAAVSRAISCAERRLDAHDDGRAVLCHGDIHEWNTLAAGDGSYKLIDPDGLSAEPEYDGGVILRDPGYEYADAEWAAKRLGLDAKAVWDWATVERLSSALTIRQLGLEPAATEWLAAAERTG